MNKFLSQLNLTPQERRVVVVIFLAVIIVLDWVFVWPHFGDWGRMNRQLEEMRKTEANYNHVIEQDRNPTNGWAIQALKLASLEGGQSGVVAEHSVDPQIQFQNTIRVQERKTGVFIGNITPGAVKTNEFFEEHTTLISIESLEPNLVNFLYNMGNDPAMIRVAKLDLKPVDMNRYRLKGGVTLTANYKKPAPPAAVAAVQSAPGAKPAAAPATKPATAPAQPAKHAPGGPPPGAGPRLPPRSNPLLSPRPRSAPGQRDANRNP